MYKLKLQPIKSINIQKSYYIKTANRMPLLLDLSFSKFILKYDDLLCN